MRYQILVRTKKGRYGQELRGQSHHLGNVLEQVIPRLDELPNELGGEKFIDWTNINIQIVREPK